MNENIAKYEAIKCLIEDITSKIEGGVLPFRPCDVDIPYVSGVIRKDINSALRKFGITNSNYLIEVSYNDKFEIRYYYEGSRLSLNELLLILFKISSETSYVRSKIDTVTQTVHYMYEDGTTLEGINKWLDGVSKHVTFSYQYLLTETKDGLKFVNLNTGSEHSVHYVVSEIITEGMELSVKETAYVINLFVNKVYFDPKNFVFWDSMGHKLGKELKSNIDAILETHGVAYSYDIEVSTCLITYKAIVDVFIKGNKVTVEELFRIALGLDEEPLSKEINKKENGVKTMENIEIPNILSVTAEPRTYLDITILNVNSVATKTSVAVGDIIEYKAISEGKKLQGIARISNISSGVLHLDASEQFTSNKFQLNVQDLREIKLHSEGEEV